MKDFPFDFLAVEGNIGTGKTTFCRMLERDFGCRLILEQFTDNPFLPFFYENPERYAFPVELFFMTERHKQLQELLSQAELFPSTTVSDYYFIKTLLFARNNLNETEFRLFERLFRILNQSFRDPDVLLYLHRPVDELVRNIHNRGRAIEQNIRADYLKGIESAYFTYFRTQGTFPVLVLDLGPIDFQENEKAYEGMLDLLRRKHSPGFHFLRWDPGSDSISRMTDFPIKN